MLYRGTPASGSRNFWDGPTHAGLQIADYCAWMIQRHLENPTDPQAMHIKAMMDPRIANLYLPFD